MLYILPVVKVPLRLKKTTNLFRSGRGCTTIVTIQEEFVSYYSASDATTCLLSPLPHLSLLSSLCQLLRKMPHLQLPRENEVPVAMCATSGKDTSKGITEDMKYTPKNTGNRIDLIESSRYQTQNLTREGIYMCF